MSNPGPKDLPAGQFLERRQPAAVRGVGRATARRPTLVAAPEFKRLLMKYLKRQNRQGRLFSLVKLEVLEYAYVSDTLGIACAKQLHKSVQEILLKGLRASDRLCPIFPGQFLLLLPDTKRLQAQSVVDRSCRKLANYKATYRRQAVNVSMAFSIVDAAEAESDLQSLLKLLGLDLDDGGRFVRFQAAESSAAAMPDTASLPVWLKRYRQIRQIAELRYAQKLQVDFWAASDLWSAAAPVVMKIITAFEPEAIFSAGKRADLLKRARSLQLLRHPLVLGINDYHLQDGNRLYLVRNQADLTAVYDLDGKQQIQISEVMEWGLQILNALIYLQSLFPPLVPPSLRTCLYLDNDTRQMVLADYELPYLLPGWWRELDLGQEEMRAAAQGRPVKAYDLTIEGFVEVMQFLCGKCVSGNAELQDFLQGMQTSPLPPAFNTLYKIRTALKEIADSCKLKMAGR